MSYTNSPTRTFTAGAAIGQHLRVDLSSSKLAASGVNGNDLGTMEGIAFADLDEVAVRLRTAAGTCKMIANAAIAVGDRVYTAAAGKVGPYVVTAAVVGIALTAAGADDDIIEVMRESDSNPATRNFTAGAAIAINLRVKLTTLKLAAAGVADKELGTMEIASGADLDVRPVRLTSAPGTCRVVANAALAVGAAVFTAAAGKVGPSVSTAFYLGIALTASAIDGDVIEVLRNAHGDTAV